MYSRVCLLSIVVSLYLGHLVSKAVVEEDENIFSVPLDISYPWDRNCELMSNESDCEVDLSGSIQTTNLDTKDYGIVYTMSIGIQKSIFNVLVDTGSRVLWVTGSGCKSSNCTGHPKYKVKQKNAKVVKTMIYASGDVRINPVQDDVHLTSNLGVAKMIFGASINLPSQYKNMDGVIGLNAKEGSIINRLIRDGSLKRPAYSILAGFASEPKDNAGEITFGGVNKIRIDSKIDSVSVNMIPSGRTEFLIKAFEVGKNEFCGKKEGCRVVIDSGHVLTTGPKAFVQYMRHVTNANGKGTVDCHKIKTFPTLQVDLGGGKITLEPKYYIFKDVKTKSCFLPFGVEKDTKRQDWVFGIAFFRKHYIEFDFESNREKVVFYERAENFQDE